MEKYMNKIYIVSCTKHTEEKFFETTALGKTIRKLNLLYGNKIEPYLFTENKRGLCECYNEAIEDIIKKDGDESSILCFVHDDVFIEDVFFSEKLEKGFKDFQVIGMAGSTKWTLKHPTIWTNTKCDWSGSVFHYLNNQYVPVIFGRFLIDCVVLDGLFLSCKLGTCMNTELRFDNRLKFHHYDIDFCLTAKKLGLRMTTLPIWIIHCSQGRWQDDPVWHESEKVMLQKWSRGK